MRIISSVLIAIAMCLSLSACVPARPYQTKLGPRPGVDGRLPPPAPAEIQKSCSSPTACVVFVEFDDYGNLMNRAQMLGAVQAAEETAKANGTVLVYVHGWHNDADNDAPNVGDFKALVQRASDIDREYRPDHRGKGNILGIYVGWRGDSIASRGLTLPFSYLLTFWDRKGAAHDIGSSGGVYDLFSRLSVLRRSYRDSRLLIHGHSFGGAVVFSTVSQTLMDQIRMDANTSTAAAPEVADLVLLVNPAFEAMKLRPQLDMARSQEYQPNQPPRLVIITTEADWATGTTFPIGRTLGTLFDAYADSQSSSQNKTAVGHYIPFVTHQLALQKDSECAPGARCGNGTPSGAPPTSVPQQGVNDISSFIAEGQSSLLIPALPIYPKSKALLLRRCDEAGACSIVAGDHYIARGRVAEGYVPYRLPIMNIRTTKDVSTGHTDIRNDVLENFVLQLLALAIANPTVLPQAPEPEFK